MTLITEQKLRGTATKAYRTLSKSNASEILKEQFKTLPTTKSFDIFLSHAYLDAELILGAKQYLEEHGFSVYVDWIEDSSLDRTNVSKETASLIRERMRYCKSLIYAMSENSGNSKWMPWELGFFDGFNGKVSIMPIVKIGGHSRFEGAEFLGLYPYISEISSRLHVHDNWITFVNYDGWLKGLRPS